MEKILSAVLGNHDILRQKLDHLLRAGQFISVGVFRVANGAELLHRDRNLLRLEVRQRQVNHIIANRSVAEDVDVVLGAKDSFLERLDHAFFGD